MISSSPRFLVATAVSMTVATGIWPLAPLLRISNFLRVRSGNARNRLRAPRCAPQKIRIVDVRRSEAPRSAT